MNILSSKIFTVALLLAMSGDGYAQQKNAVYFPKKQFASYKDSLVYTMVDPGSFGSHGIYKQGKRYTFQLPKKLKDYTADTWELSFKFSDDQYVFINVNHNAKGNEPDSSFTPTEDQLRHYLPLVHWADEFKGYMPRQGRETKMFTTMGSQVLLLNIKSEEFAHFRKTVNSFRTFR